MVPAATTHDRSGTCGGNDDSDGNAVWLCSSEANHDDTGPQTVGRGHGPTGVGAPDQLDGRRVGARTAGSISPTPFSRSL